MSALIGRDIDVARVEQLLFGATPSALVTVTGPAGIGKTRLVREVVSRAKHEHRGTVRCLTGSAADAAPGAASLLVLDDADLSLAQTRSVISTTVGEYPDAQVIVTALAPLRVAGENVVRLDRLAIEPDGIALFNASIPASLRRRYDPAHVAALCTQLSGLPLAVQAAAALAEAVPPEHLVQRLGEARLLDVLGDVDLPGRRTLREAVERTYRELDDADQVLLTRLAVLTGSFAPAAVVALSDTSEGAALAGLCRLAAAGVLVDASVREGPRFAVPRVLRELALERTVEPAAVRRTALAHLTGIAAGAGARHARGDESGALAELARERVALTAAADQLAADHDVAAALEIEVAIAPAALSAWWDAAAASRLDRLTGLPGAAAADPALRLRARILSARLAVEHAPDLPMPRGALAHGLLEAVTEADAAANAELRATAIAFAAEGLWDACAPPIRHRLVAPAQRIDADPVVLAPLRVWRAVVQAELGHALAAHDIYDEARELAGAAPGRAFLAASVRLASALPDPGAALAPERLLAEARRLRDRHLQVRILTRLARTLLDRGEVEEAVARARAALKIAKSGGGADAGPATAGALAVLAECAAAHNRLLDAVVLQEVLAAVAPRASAAVLDAPVGAQLAQRRQALRTGEAARASRDAAAVTLAQAVELGRALADRLTRAVPEATDPSGPEAAARPADDITSTLTPREREVLIQLARGASNKTIGYSLGMTPKTVMHHSMSIYRKLGVHSRAEAAVIAIRQQLVPVDPA